MIKEKGKIIYECPHKLGSFLMWTSKGSGRLFRSFLYILHYLLGLLTEHTTTRKL